MMPRWMQYALGDETARFGVTCFDIEAGLDAREGVQKATDAK